MTNLKPARATLPILTQLCKLIPSHLTTSLAKKHGIDKQARTFSAWSHLVSLLFAQLTHATSLNDVCDAFPNHSRWLGSLRGATALLGQRHVMGETPPPPQRRCKASPVTQPPEVFASCTIVEEASRHDTPPFSRRKQIPCSLGRLRTRYAPYSPK